MRRDPSFPRLASAALLLAVAGLWLPIHAGYLESDFPGGRPPVVTPPPRPRPVIPPPRPRPRPWRNELQRLIDRIEVGAPTRYRGLTVFPLFARGSSAGLNARTLDEALARGWLTLREWGRGDVRRVQAVNHGLQPVFILEGEVLIGGYQDRIAAESVLLRPGQRAVIPVFCAERGRWDARAARPAAALKAGKSLALPNVRRRLAEAPSQDAVWSEIRSGLKTRGAAGRTERMARAYELPAYRREIGGYRRALKHIVSARCAGVAVAHRGRLVAIDLFDEPRLATALWQKILDSHAGEDIVYWGRAARRRIAFPAVTRAHVRSALERAYRARLTRRAGAASGETLTLSARGLHGRALAYRGSCVHAGLYMDEMIIQPVPPPRLVPPPRIIQPLPRPRVVPQPPRRFPLAPPEEEAPPPRRVPLEPWPR